MKPREWVWPLRADGTNIVDASGWQTGIYSSYETEQDEYGFEKASTYDECSKRVRWIVDCMNRAFEAECKQP